MSLPTAKIAWVEMDLSKIMEYFIKGFKIKEGEVLSHDYYVDVSKRRVVFKLYVDTDNPPKPAS